MSCAPARQRRRPCKELQANLLRFKRLLGQPVPHFGKRGAQPGCTRTPQSYISKGISYDDRA